MPQRKRNFRWPTRAEAAQKKNDARVIIREKILPVKEADRVLTAKDIGIIVGLSTPTIHKLIREMVPSDKKGKKSKADGKKGSSKSVPAKVPSKRAAQPSPLARWNTLQASRVQLIAQLTAINKAFTTIRSVRMSREQFANAMGVLGNKKDYAQGLLREVNKRLNRVASSVSKSFAENNFVTDSPSPKMLAEANKEILGLIHKQALPSGSLSDLLKDNAPTQRASRERSASRSSRFMEEVGALTHKNSKEARLTASALDARDELIEKGYSKRAFIKFRAAVFQIGKFDPEHAAFILNEVRKSARDGKWPVKF